MTAPNVWDLVAQAVYADKLERNRKMLIEKADRRNTDRGFILDRFNQMFGGGFQEHDLADDIVIGHYIIQNILVRVIDVPTHIYWGNQTDPLCEDDVLRELVVGVRCPVCFGIFDNVVINDVTDFYKALFHYPSVCPACRRENERQCSCDK